MWRTHSYVPRRAVGMEDSPAFCVLLRESPPAAMHQTSLDVARASSCATISILRRLTATPMMYQKPGWQAVRGDVFRYGHLPVRPVRAGQAGAVAEDREPVRRGVESREVCHPRLIGAPQTRGESTMWRTHSCVPRRDSSTACVGLSPALTVLICGNPHPKPPRASRRVSIVAARPGRSIVRRNSQILGERGSPLLPWMSPSGWQAVSW